MDWDVRLALGSNMGDRDSHLAAARELIAERVLQEMEWSPIHQTEAVGPSPGALSESGGEGSQSPPGSSAIARGVLADRDRSGAST